MKFLHICAGWQKWNGAVDLAQIISMTWTPISGRDGKVNNLI